MPREPRPDDLARAAADEPPEALYTEAETVGVVKFWRDARGHGAIASDATAPWDIWCPFSAIDMPGFKALVPGERVAVRYVLANQDSFRYVARRVLRLDSDLRAPDSSGGAG
jgi:cold shock protein